MNSGLISHTPEFKENLVKKYHAGKQSLEEIANTHNLSPTILRLWVDKYERTHGKPKEASTDLTDIIKRLDLIEQDNMLENVNALVNKKLAELNVMLTEKIKNVDTKLTQLQDWLKSELDIK